MQSCTCPFCLKIVQTEICPYCGNDVNYSGYPNHLPAGYTLTGNVPYILGVALGQGGFGITYIALNTITGQRVAIKEYFPNHCCGRNNSTYVYPSYGQEDTFIKGRAHFLQEAQMLQSLSDIDSIVKVYDYFEANNSAYLVMEFLDGRSLKDHVEHHGKMEAQSFLQQIRPLMDDMVKMHQRGVVHRDIAPDNIILLPDGQLKLIDFGAARSFVGDRSMTVVVKKGFAPVEQYMRKGSSISTDVYALAATIYYCITGTVPPDSAERQYGDVAIMAPSALGANLTPMQEHVLEKALELQPMDRIQTVSQVCDLLFTTDIPTGQQIFYESSRHTIQENSTVIVESLQIVYDYDRMKAFLKPVLRNLSAACPQKIMAELRCKDPDGRQVCLTQFTLSCNQTDDRICDEIPVELPHTTLSHVYLTIIRICSADGTEQICGENAETVPVQESLELCLEGNAKLLKQYRAETTKKAVWEPYAGAYHWQCCCGRANPGSAIVCNQCGTGKQIQFSALNPETLAQTIAEKETEHARIAVEKAERRKQARRIQAQKQRELLINTAKIATAAAAVAAVVFVGSRSVNTIRYTSAEKALQNANYQKAYNTYLSLKDFRDSSLKAKETKYRQGSFFQNTEEFLDAAAAFDAASGYQDSIERAAYCRKEAAYAEAAALYDAGMYREAAESFKALGDHSDSVSRMNDSFYRYGTVLLDEGSYGEAYTVFTDLGTYRDSPVLRNRSGYQYAGMLCNAGNYHEAYLTYNEFPDYEDSFSLGQEAEYRYGLDCVTRHDYPEGIAAFQRLNGYKDSGKNIQTAQYAYANQLMAESRWEEAALLYETLGSYKDSKEQYKESRYQYGHQLMNEQQYILAVDVFTALGKYSSSASDLLEAKYLYTSSHPDRKDPVTAQYLDDLKQISYKDSAALYQKLFGWRITLTAVNTDIHDGNTFQTSVSKTAPHFHFRFLLEGGKPSETIDVRYSITWPSGIQKAGQGEWTDASDGCYLDCTWDRGFYEDTKKGKTGKLTIQIYNKATGEFLGEGSVTLTE